MCKTHNAYMAELDYGKEKMDQFRRSADRARETQAPYGRQAHSEWLPAIDHERNIATLCRSSPAAN